MKEIEKIATDISVMRGQPERKEAIIKLIQSLSLQSSKGISEDFSDEAIHKYWKRKNCFGQYLEGLVTGSIDLRDRMRSKLSEGSKTNGWVDVKDRLPEGTWTKHEWQKHLSQDVLFRNDVAMFIGRWNRENYWWETGAPVKGNWVDDVTHWMPLPLPPKI